MHRAPLPMDTKIVARDKVVSAQRGEISLVSHFFEDWKGPKSLSELIKASPSHAGN